jgi:hypothetical protein
VFFVPLFFFRNRYVNSCSSGAKNYKFDEMMKIQIILVLLIVIITCFNRVLFADIPYNPWAVCPSGQYYDSNKLGCSSCKESNAEGYINECICKEGYEYLLIDSFSNCTDCFSLDMVCFFMCVPVSNFVINIVIY